MRITISDASEQREGLIMSRLVSCFVAVCVLAGAVLLSAGAGWTQVPEKINYQVRITDSVTGEPEPGEHELVFRIFQQEIGGAAVWDETHNIEADETGVVSLILGSSNPIDVDFHGAMWLEVEVDGETLEPRREIVSVPYALRAMDSDNADSLGGVSSDDYIVEGEVGVVTDDMIVEAYADSAHDHDDRYYTQDQLDTAGSLNDSGNPVDWTKLKNVPAGFADEIDNVGGVGDGYSLDADDGDPVDALYVDDAGEVGIGKTNPTAELHIYRNVNDVTSIVIENPNTGSSSTERLSFRNENGDVCGVAAYDDGSPYPAQLRIFNNRPNGSINLSAGGLGLHVKNGGDVGVGTTTPSEKLEVDGKIQADGIMLGTTSLDGNLEIYRSGTADPIFDLDDTYDTGAVMWLREDGGSYSFKLEPDVNTGGGAWMAMTRLSGVAGITIDGNNGGSGNPRFNIAGSSRFAALDMSSSGNSSVVLPVDAVSSSEILDEPGVASDRALYTPPGTLLSSGYNALDSVSIYAPTSGYVLVLATCQPTFMHDGTVLTQANFGVSDTRSSLPANQDISLRIDTNIGDGVGSNVDELPVTVHGLFRANSSGTYEYFLLSYLFSGTITLNDVQLTAVFFPTNYGSVSPTLAEGPQPLGDESKGVRAEERLGAPSPSPSAEEVYMARIEGEMAAMRAELEALKQELQNGNRRED